MMKIPEMRLPRYRPYAAETIIREKPEKKKKIDKIVCRRKYTHSYDVQKTFGMAAYRGDWQLNIICVTINHR